MDKKNNLDLRELKIEKLMNAMEVFEASQHIIAKRALSYALLHEDDYEAMQLFELMRDRAAVEDDVVLEFDGYIEHIGGLRDMAQLSDQDRVVRDLAFLMRYFTDNRDIMSDLLKGIKRAHLYDGLRRNAHNN